MKYFKYIVTLFIILFFTGCLIGASNSTYTFVMNQDINALEKFRQNGGDVNKYYNTLGNYSSNKTTLGLAVARSKYESVKYLLENGANVNDKRNKVSDTYVRGYDLVTMALYSKDRRILKILLDYNAPNDNFRLYKDYYSTSAYVDTSTACGFRQYICDNKTYAKKYYHKKQLKKQDIDNEIINNEIDNLLGI